MGEKRIISVASILAYDPDLLLLDEPTANLSSIPIDKIEKIIKEAKNSSKSIVIASHDVEFVAKVSDRVYVIDSGRMLGGTDTRSILSDNRLLSLADMKPPLVSQTLRALGVKKQKIPLTIDELKDNKSQFLKKL
jgi:energy-coupling factor transporter ATP-binding protein EcfA2